MHKFENLFKKVGGLSSKAIWVLGPGYAKEDFKMTALEMGIPFRSDLWISYQDFLARYVSEFQSERMLEADARVALLKRIFRNPSAQKSIPELVRISKRPRFFESLDRTLQEGREFFESSDDGAVILEYLENHSRPRKMRNEFFILDQYWTQTLLSLDLWDLARLKREALLQMRTAKADHVVDQHLVWVFSGPLGPLDLEIRNRAQSLSSAFTEWESATHNESILESTSDYRRAHSFADALEYLADDVVQALNQNRSVHILIQDQKEIRSGITRTLKRRGVHLSDPRNPRYAIENESLKAWVSALRVVAYDFSLSEVRVGLSFFGKGSVDHLRLWIDQNSARWNRSMIAQHPELSELFRPLILEASGRISFVDFHEYALSVLKKSGVTINSWVELGIQRLFQSWQKSLEQTGDLFFRRFLFQWVQDLEDKLGRANIPAEPFRIKNGVSLFRVDQAPSPRVLIKSETDRTAFFCFGITPEFFKATTSNLMWFDRRDRERMSFEFNWPSERVLNQDRMKRFHAWTGQFPFRGYGWRYGADGKEAEGLDQVFSSLTVQDVGCHPRMLNSLQGARNNELPQFSKVELPLAVGISGFSHYSACSFRGVSAQILKLEDEREVKFDLQADQLGRLIHRVLEIHMKERRSTIQVLDEQWPQFSSLWVQFSERALRMQKKRIQDMLLEFEKDEENYRQVSEGSTQVAHLEFPVEWDRGGLLLKGRVDRIDRHADGFLIFDYKTSEVLANAHQFSESGREGQILIYGAALKVQMGVPVLGGVYIRLKKDNCERRKGFLFKPYAKGSKKDPAKQTLIPLAGASQSIVKENEDDYWNKVYQRIDQTVVQWKMGTLDANPESPKNCDKCRYQAVCGEARLAPADDIPIETSTD